MQQVLHKIDIVNVNKVLSDEHAYLKSFHNLIKQFASVKWTYFGTAQGTVFLWMLLISLH